MKKIVIYLFLLIFSSGLKAELVINEVMYNEPEGYTSLEWIELYNNSDTAVNLNEFQLNVNGSFLSLPYKIISGDEYLLIVRKLYKGSGTTSFETFWGNDTEIWGDDPFELTMAEPIEISFSLPNSSGFVQGIYNSLVTSSFYWEEAGDDGVSYERVFPDSSYYQKSTAKTFSTPGRVNSVTPLSFDISLDSIKPYFEGRSPLLIYSVTNRSLDSLEYFSIHLSDAESFNELIYVPIDYLDLNEPFVETLFVPSELWMYRDVTASLHFITSDDRPENDTIQFTMIGYLYPPLVISEFLASPPFAFEWVELYNRSDSTIDLYDWKLGDALQSNRITDTSVFLSPQSYAVITNNKSMFEGYYPLTIDEILLVEQSLWGQLNNDTDSIRLVDNYDIQADLLVYELPAGNEFAYGREFLVPYFPEIQRSELKLGSPGLENVLFTYSKQDKVHINLSSKYFSYNSDELVISVTIPETDAYSIKIFNKQGQLVSSIVDDDIIAQSDFFWRGENVTGQELPVGIYIIVVEAEGVAKAKETFVIVK